MYTGVFTFGCGDAERRNKFVRITAKTDEEARAAMFARFGREWGFQYNMATAATQAMIEEYKLKVFCSIDLLSSDDSIVFVRPVFSHYNNKVCEAIMFDGALYTPVSGSPLFAIKTDGVGQGSPSHNPEHLSYGDDHIITYEDPPQGVSALA